VLPGVTRAQPPTLRELYHPAANSESPRSKPHRFAEVRWVAKLQVGLAPATLAGRPWPARSKPFGFAQRAAPHALTCHQSQSNPGRSDQASKIKTPSFASNDARPETTQSLTQPGPALPGFSGDFSGRRSLSNAALTARSWRRCSSWAASKAPKRCALASIQMTRRSNSSAVSFTS